MGSYRDYFSELKTRVKIARQAVDAAEPEQAEKVRLAQQRLGKASALGRIHKNQAARRTSRLMKRTATTKAG